MYDMIIARRLAEKATLELWIVALRLDPKERVLIHANLVPSATLDAMNQETNRIAELANVIYPQPKREAAK
jgi:hypothetical protein